MQLLIARYVVLPAASRSTSATVQAPQSPSAQPCLLPVRPLVRSQSSSVVVGETPSIRTFCPLITTSKEVGDTVAVGEEELMGIKKATGTVRGKLKPRPAW